MRILHVTATMNPRAGGVAEAVRLLGSALVRAGHGTAVVTTDAPGGDWEQNLPFPVHARGPGRSGVYGYTPGLIEFLRGQRDQWDCVISHGLWQFHGFAAWRAWRGPRFVFPHGMLDPWFKHTYPKKHLKKWLYWPWAEYRLLRSARAVFFTCEEERRLARQSFWLYRVNEAVNPLGIEEPPSDAEHQKALFFARFPELCGKRLVLFLGRLVVKKGVAELLAAFQQMRGKPTDAALVMAGPDDEVDPAFSARMRAESTGRTDVHWPGMLTGDLKWGALRAAEAFILPSHQENFGLAVVEALACGTPVLISDKVNLWREIKADAAGRVEDDTVEGSTKLLEACYNASPEASKAMSQAARRSFEQRYQVDCAAAALVENLRGFGVADALTSG